MTARTNQTLVIREERRARVARMLLTTERPTASKIAEVIGVSRAMVIKDMREIREEWRKSRYASQDEAVAREVERLAMVEREAWSAVAQCRKPRTVKQTKTYKNAAGATVEEVTFEEHQHLSSAQHLRIILGCVERRSKLLGLDAPTEIVGAFGVKTMGDDDILNAILFNLSAAAKKVGGGTDPTVLLAEVLQGKVKGVGGNGHGGNGHGLPAPGNGASG